MLILTRRSGVFSLFAAIGLLWQFSLLTHPVLGQNRYTISGSITEAASNEKLIGASLYLPELKTGTTTNQYGFYSITIPQGNYEVVINYLGYQEVRQQVSLDGNLERDFQLEQVSAQLEELVVRDVAELNALTSKMPGLNTLNARTIKQVPVVFGEPDVVKSLLLLPGVTNAGEASTGFNVRGGTADQNLILLDEATIYNASHLFGLFSAFNPDAVKDVKLYKAGIPARYGGRVSSVLEIFQKEGNSREFKMSGGIGAVASRLLAEGPIKKDKSSFLLGARGSYAHLFLPLIDNDNSAWFFDLNAKLGYRLGKRDQLLFSGYYGKDVFNLNDNYDNRFSNGVFNARWNHLFSDRLFSNLSLIYSRYFSRLELDFEGLIWDSAIDSYNLKYDLKHYLSDRLKLNYGMDHFYYIFNPGTVEPNTDDSGIIPDQLTRKYALQSAVYIDLEQDLGSRFKAEYGLRLSYFNRLGQDELNVYENDDPLVFNPFTLVYQGATPIAVSTPGRNGSLEQFFNLEPRLALSFEVSATGSLSGSFTRLAQYLHLVSNTSSPTPLDVWAPSGPFIEPQKLNQYSIGYRQELGRGAYSVETDLFYKTIDNRIDYIDGADLIAQDAVEQVILNGEARVKGIEWLVQKKSGRLRGWLAYTLSNSEQRTPGREPTVDNGRSNMETGINLGQWYNTPFNKNHDLALHVSHDVGKKWRVNANFIYQTGQPANYPIGQFDFQGITTPYYGLRNKQRLSDYHRLDISATLVPVSKGNGKWESEWVFSIYNLYNRQNAASLNFRRNQDTGVNEAVRTSIFGIVPAVTYNFKF